MIGFAAALIAAATHVYAAEASLPQDAREAAPRRIAAADLQADLAVLRSALEAIHPGLYRYNTRAEMQSHFATLATAFSRDLTPGEALLALSQFTATIRCGHTFPNPSNQKRAMVQELFARQDKVPFAFRWIDRRMIITRNGSGDARLAKGTEVIEINGTAVGRILDGLMSIARADGSNDAKRIRQLEVWGEEQYEPFDMYFPLMFPSAGTTLQLTIRPIENAAPGDEITTITAQSLTHEARLAAMAGAEPGTNAPGTVSEDQPLWRISYLDEHIAYLPMNSWVAYKTKWNWIGFINGTFDELIAKNVPNLVIDLRGNEGGSGVGDVILARLIDKATPASANQQFVRYLRTPAELDAVLDTWDDSFRDWSAQAVGPVDLADRWTGLADGETAGFYRLREAIGPDGNEVDEVIRPAGERFRGRVFVLIDASNSSATFEFASMIKSLRLGTLVGQPTGGNKRGINGGAFFFLRLPKSGLEVDLPIKAQFPRPGSQPRDDAGITPDVVVSPSVQAIVRGEDQELQTVMRLIAEKRE